MNTNPTEHKPAEQFLVISSNLANITGRTREVMEGAIKIRICESRVDRQWWVVLNKRVCMIAAKFP